MQGVTGSLLRVLGMLRLEVEIGGDKKIKQWFSVVPNKYFERTYYSDVTYYRTNHFGVG